MFHRNGEMHQHNHLTYDNRQISTWCYCTAAPQTDGSWRRCQSITHTRLLFLQISKIALELQHICNARAQLWVGQWMWPAGHITQHSYPYCFLSRDMRPVIPPKIPGDVHKAIWYAIPSFLYPYYVFMGKKRTIQTFAFHISANKSCDYCLFDHVIYCDCSRAATIQGWQKYGTMYVPSLPFVHALTLCVHDILHTRPY